MNTQLRTCLSFLVVAILGFAALLLTKPTRADEIDPPEYFLYLIDRSGSMRDLPDNTLRSMLIHSSKVAKLAKGKVHFGVITFAGQKIQVYGDPNQKAFGQIEMPTTAHDQLLNRVLSDWQEPSGATPMDIALEYVIAMLNEIEPNSKVTVVYCGDGMPYSGWVRAEDFPEVADYLRSRVEGVSQQNYPPQILEEMRQTLLASLQNPESEEAQRVLNLQAKAEMVRCQQYVADLVKAGVRFVTFAFEDIPELREIHTSANADPQDYIVLKPASSVVEQLHNLGLTDFNGVAKLVPNQVDAKSDVYEETIQITTPAIGDRLVVTVLITPYNDFATHSKLVFEYDGQRFELDPNDNSDPNIAIGYDESGKLASVTLTLDEVPQDERLMIHYDSPNVSKPLPEMTIISHLRLADDLVVDFRPTIYSAKSRPVTISPNLKKPYVAGLYRGDERLPYPLNGMQAIAQGHDSEQTIDFVPDSSTVGQFVTDGDLQFTVGKKDVIFFMELPDGTSFSLTLPGFIDCRNSNEYLTIEYLSDPQREFIFFPELGDETVDFKHDFKIRPSKELQYSVPISLSVQGLVDSQGNTLPSDIIKISRPTFNTQSSGTQISLLVKIPEGLVGVANGRISGQLHVVRADLNMPIEVRNFSFANTMEDPTRIEFSLNQPQFQVIAPRKVFGLGYDELDSKGGIDIYVDMWVPMRRKLQLEVRTTSAMPRECALVVEDDMKDANGKPYNFIKLSNANELVANRISPRSTATWPMNLVIPEHPGTTTLTTNLILTGKGVAPKRIPVRVHFRDETALYAPITKNYLKWSGISLLGIFAILAFGAYRLTRRFGRGARHEVSRQKSAPLLSLLGKHLQVKGRPGKTMYKKHTDDRRPLPTPQQLHVDRIQPNTEFFEGDRAGKPTGLAVEVTKKKVVKKEPVLTVIVRKSGDMAGKIAKRRTRCKRALFMAVIAFLLATFIYTSAVVASAQFVIDVGRKLLSFI